MGAATMGRVGMAGWLDGRTAGRRDGGTRKEDEQWEKKKRESYGGCLRRSKEVKLGAEEERAKGQEAVRVAAAWARGKWKRESCGNPET